MGKAIDRTRDDLCEVRAHVRCVSVAVHLTHMRQAMHATARSVARVVSLTFALFSVGTSPSAAQSLPQEPRVALIIANFDYPGANDRLRGPLHDADVLSMVLAKQGFSGIDGRAGPTVVTNANLQKMKESIGAFRDRLSAAGPLAIGFLYFAGHGASNARGTDNFLLPVDVPDVAKADVEKSGYGVRALVTLLQQIRVPPHQPLPRLIIVVDACRTADPTAATPHVENGAASGQRTSRPGAAFVKPDEDQPKGVLVALSTGPGQIASDNGLYSDALATYLGTPGLKLDDVFTSVRLDMAARTKNTQIPEYASQINEKLCLAGCTAQVVGPDPMTSLKTAMELRPMGDTGQVAAAEQLTRDHKSMAGLDLNGVYFAKARLNDAQLQGIDLTVANLEGASIEQADISGAFFTFANLKVLHAERANATETRFYFAAATGAVFSNLKGPRSNWQAASLRGANFRGADLQGASFMMADLRDADFTGADLRGTFFNGALIAGARFGQARISNTDFSAAVGSANQFTPEQQAGLCGTEGGDREDLYRYTLRSFDKNAAIGDRYHDIFADWVTLRSGLRYLEPCVLHATTTAGRAPIWSTGKAEAMGAEFVLDFAPQLLDAGDRKATIVRRAHEALASINEEQKKGTYIAIPGKAQRARLDALRRNIGNAALVTPAFLDIEATFLYQVRFRPESISNAMWYQRARWWADRDGSGPHQPDTGRNQWPQFFATGTHGADLSDPDVDAFKQWTINRARQFPTRIQFDLTSPAMEGLMYNMQNAEYDPTHTPYAAIFPVVVYAKEHPPYDSAEVKAKIPNYDNGFQAADGAVHLRKPLASYSLQLPRSMAPTIRKERPVPRAQLEIRSVESFNLSDRHFNVLEGDLLDLHIQTSDGVRVP